MTHRLTACLLAALLLAGCGDRKEDSQLTVEAGAAAVQGLDKIKRADFNRRAAELFLPLFWRSDANENAALDPDELVALWGVADGGQIADYVADGQFTPKFLEVYGRMREAPVIKHLLPAEQKRRRAVLEELAQGRPTLIESDFSTASAGDKAMVENILAAARLIEQLYARQTGVLGMREQVPADDPASQMLMYRNQSPYCEAPKTEANPDCRALAERPPKISGLYPASTQNGTDTRFCALLEARADAVNLLEPFTVVVPKTGGRAEGNAATDELEAIPYSAAYRNEMTEISSKLLAASLAIQDPAETPMKLYLAAAAESFLSNEWHQADEAWARMNAGNSKWYLRIAPDETYAEPCSRKAMFHMSFARINPGGVEWQKRLEPRKAQMEEMLAKLAGEPYAARGVSFQLPDFIDIVLNAGDSRSGLGSTIGQSLPNWGPVANEGRGRTVAMVNLYTDEDSQMSRRATALSLYCPRTFKQLTFEPGEGVMSTVLHEAAHNLGPSHEYRVEGRTASEIFGGPMASLLEELKAQTAALYFTGWLSREGLVDRDVAAQANLDNVSWAFGHIAQGMRDTEGKPKPYSQLASMQMGSFFRDQALLWKPGEKAANGKDAGCFDVDLEKWPAAVDQLAARVLRIKGAGDRKEAEALRAELVDAADKWAELREVIRERVTRAPKASFVYAINR